MEAGDQTIEIFLDPDGTHEIGHYVLVERKTGIRYSTQCGGALCAEHGAEGFLVTAGPWRAFEAIGGWFYKKFGTGCPTWNEANTAELEPLVAEVYVWPDEGGKTGPVPLTLDTERISECLEAWVPVCTPWGKGWLLGRNSD